MGCWWIIIILFAMALVLVCGSKSGFQMSSSIREGYRDPIWLNRQKLVKNWYPNTYGSIYGFPRRYGGSWDIFSGYPVMDKVY